MDAVKFARLAKKYNTTESALAAMWGWQDGRCVITDAVLDGSDRYRHMPVVDHCHACGEVRGILSSNANRFLGYMRDSPYYVRGGAEYVRRPPLASLNLVWAKSRPKNIAALDAAGVEPVCAITGSRKVGLDGKALHVDHCHSSGLVRGYLDGWCNGALGVLDDDAASMLAAAAYLERHRCR